MKSLCSFLFSLSIVRSIWSYRHSIYGITCSYSLTNSGALSIRRSSAKINCYKRPSEEKYSTATAKGPCHSSQPTNIMLEAVTTTPATRYKYLHAAQSVYTNIFIFVHQIRVPSWTDRILFKVDHESGIDAILNSYESIDNITSSDHKPVKAHLCLQVKD